MVLRQTMRKRMQAKLRAIKEGLRRRMHWPVGKTGRWLQAVVSGYYRYYAVPRNSPALKAFRIAVTRLWYRTLRRRSQKDRITWKRLAQWIRRWIPLPRIVHPYPEQRLAVMTQGRSPVR